MPRECEGDFDYVFPDGWQVKKWDDTSFHKTLFQSFGGSSKAVEFVAYSDEADSPLWLIECKDFRPNGRNKTIDLCDEIAQKIKSSLAGLVCARNSQDSDLKRFARMALKKTDIRCVVHWEHPLRPHRLWPREFMDRSSIRDKLRQRLAVADPKAEIGNIAQLNTTMPWKIERHSSIDIQM